MTINPTCSTCRFWQPLRAGGEGYAEDRNYEIDDDGEGLCRRLPPIGQRGDMPRPSGEPTYATDAAMWAQWPVTSGDVDWCGEHHSRVEVA